MIKVRITVIYPIVLSILYPQYYNFIILTFYLVCFYQHGHKFGKLRSILLYKSLWYKAKMENLVKLNEA